MWRRYALVPWKIPTDRPVLNFQKIITLLKSLKWIFQSRSCWHSPLNSPNSDLALIKDSVARVEDRIIVPYKCRHSWLKLWGIRCSEGGSTGSLLTISDGSLEVIHVTNTTIWGGVVFRLLQGKGRGIPKATYFAPAAPCAPS